MASALQSAVTSVLQYDYASRASISFRVTGLTDAVAVIAITVFAYDYILTFTREVEYIWNNHWTVVSTLFVLVRYLGLFSFIMLSLMGSSFFPGPANIRSCWDLGTGSQWTTLVFICAADLVMMLRLWAMYGRSRKILGILAVSYLVEVIPSVIACIVYSYPQNSQMVVISLLNLSFCSGISQIFNWNGVSSIVQLSHAIVMCTLVIIQFIRELIQMQRVTKQWRLSQFMDLLVMQGVIYFLFMLVWNVLNALAAWGKFSPIGWENIPTFIVGYIPVPVLIPRFILEIRELHANRIHSGFGGGMDSEFGLADSSFDFGMGRSASRVQRDGFEHDEEVSTEERSV